MGKFLTLLLVFVVGALIAQDTTKVEKKEKDKRPVRSAFGSGLHIYNHTHIIPKKKTLEFDIYHRFGEVKNGITDIYGIYASSNTKMALNYSITDKLLIGIGTTRYKKYQDVFVKWSPFVQTRSGSFPLSITYYGNMVIDARNHSQYENTADRLSYFHQILIGRKISNKLSVQIAPSIAHYNVVDTAMSNDIISLALCARYKLTGTLAVLAEYNQPLTNHDENEVMPGIGIGFEILTTSHAFQIVFGSYDGIINQENSVYNTRDYTKGELLIGFNMTRLWFF